MAHGGAIRERVDAIVTGEWRRGCSFCFTRLLDHSILVFRRAPPQIPAPYIESCHIDFLFSVQRKKVAKIGDKKSPEQIGRLCYKQQRWNATIPNNKCPM